MNILLTGATGFIGSEMARQLNLKQETRLALALRSPKTMTEGLIHVVGDLTADTDWSVALKDQQVVIHTAARAHIMKDEVVDPVLEYCRVNVDGTLNLAKQAAAAGVRRFIFISSIGVNGNINTGPFTAADQPEPVDAYAQSKWMAEQGLWRIQNETGMELVIIRPPLVYGANAPGNFSALMRWVKRGVPLPLGAVHNKRTLIGLDNLVDLVIRCIDHPAAANQMLLAGDGEDISTTELLRGVAKAMGRPARLIPVPVTWLKLAATLIGKKATAEKLLGSLQVDISKTRELLGWEPPVTVEEGLKRCFRDTTA